MNTKTGTAYYVAPEVLAGNYDLSCDVWSLGVILHILLVGYPPFHGSSEPEIYKKIRNEEVKFREDDWEGISESACDVVRRMLIKSPCSRISIWYVVQHSWLSESPSRSLTAPLNI